MTSAEEDDDAGCGWTMPSRLLATYTPTLGLGMVEFATAPSMPPGTEKLPLRYATPRW